MKAFLLAAAGAGILLAAAPASAQPDLSKVEVKVEKIAPGVAVLFGAGGNIGLSYGADGNIIVDDQYAPMSDRILAAIATVDPDPVRFVVNTHWHGDHTGGNEAMGSRGAVIVAHNNVRTRMSSEQFIAALDSRVPASLAAALPVVTFEDGVALHLNGDTLHVVHVAKAHTDGDSLVHWQKGNPKGLHLNWAKARSKLIELPPTLMGLDLQALIVAMDRFEQALHDLKV